MRLPMADPNPVPTALERACIVDAVLVTTSMRAGVLTVDVRVAYVQDANWRREVSPREP